MKTQRPITVDPQHMNRTNYSRSKPVVQQSQNISKKITTKKVIRVYLNEVGCIYEGQAGKSPFEKLQTKTYSVDIPYEKFNNELIIQDTDMICGKEGYMITNPYKINEIHKHLSTLIDIGDYEWNMITEIQPTGQTIQKWISIENAYVTTIVTNL